VTTVGFVGLGLIGARRFQIVEQLGHSIAFAIDPDESRHSKLDMPACTFATCTEMLDPEVIDPVEAVFIAVPHDLALEYCAWAFRLGFHVLCEKPMGISTAQAKKIQRLSVDADRRFGAGLNYRFLPGVDALRALITDGHLGDLYQLRLSIGHGGRPGMEQEWKVQRARAGGGALIDPGIHLIDLARYLGGEPVVQSARMSRRFWEADVEDNCSVVLGIGDIDVGIEVSLTCWESRFAIDAYGRDGCAFIRGRGGNYGSQRLRYVNRWFWQDDNRRYVQELGSDDPSFHLETAAFLDAIVGGSIDPRLSDATDGLTALSLVEELYELAGAPG
jgi:predicted dehydrogenase